MRNLRSMIYFKHPIRYVYEDELIIFEYIYGGLIPLFAQFSVEAKLPPAPISVSVHAHTFKLG